MAWSSKHSENISAFQMFSEGHKPYGEGMAVALELFRNGVGRPPALEVVDEVRSPRE